MSAVHTKRQLVFLGAPGSGKGTQASFLVKNYSYFHVSTGDILREEIRKGTALGLRAKGIMEKGQLVDDATVLDLLKANCNLSNGYFIFDGFPRTLNQAEMLSNQLLEGHEYIAIYFEINLEVLISRATNRRVAPKSGMIYNLLTKPPRVPGKCDVSGEELVHRKDDFEDVVRNRIEVFKSSIEDLLTFYRKNGVLRIIDASADESEVKRSLLENIK